MHSKLPGELRNEVYRHLAKSNDLALLTVCRQTHDEMQPIVEEEVPRRIFISGYWTDNWQGSGCRRNAERAQNWEVHWTPSSYPPQLDLRSIGVDRWATLRAESEVQRRRCIVFLEGALGFFVNAADVLAIGSLAGFNVVQFRNRFEDLRGRSIQKVLPGLERMLEPVLGAGEQGEDGDGQYLVFRPVRKMGECPSQRAQMAHFCYDCWFDERDWLGEMGLDFCADCSINEIFFGPEPRACQLIRLERGEAAI